IFGEAVIEDSLIYGGLIALLVTFILFFRHMKQGELTISQFGKGIVEGIKSMSPAFFILIFAWSIAFLIEELQTGDYLGGLIQQANLNLMFLPLIVFIMAAFIAFSTGTSWGSFGILFPIAGQITSATAIDMLLILFFMAVFIAFFAVTSWGSFGILLPIAGQIAAATDIELLLPLVAAVLAGGVFGDHCSPISDTTILSSAGAGCHHIDHVMPQLPYALTAAGVAGAGFLMLGVTDNTWLG